ncbi:MAG: tryptophan synthase subunit alpha [Myxococcaceae bacterium]
MATTFEHCRARNETALVAYVMAGDPDLATSEAMALACLDGGADILELGMPFSDPIADGPTIQLAAERALKSGTTVERCLTLAAQLRRKRDAPLLLMGYLNPVLSFGIRAFFAACAKSGVDGVILPDLPPEEADDICVEAQRQGVATVFLLAPTSTLDRREAAFARCTGFLYFVSVTGVTGARAELPKDLGQRVDALRKRAPVPLVVGFGISSPEQAKALGAHADGVVVGSAIVARIAAKGARRAKVQDVRRFVGSLKKALRPSAAKEPRTSKASRSIKPARGRSRSSKQSSPARGTGLLDRD